MYGEQPVIHACLLQYAWGHHGFTASTIYSCVKVVESFVEHPLCQFGCSVQSINSFCLVGCPFDQCPGMIPIRILPCFLLKPTKLGATRDRNSRLPPIRHVLEVGPPRRQDSAGGASDAAGVAPHSEEPRFRQRACGLLWQPDERPESHLAVQLAHHQCHARARAQGPRVAAGRRPLQLQPRHRPTLSYALCGAEAFAPVRAYLEEVEREKKTARAAFLSGGKVFGFTSFWFHQWLCIVSLLSCRSKSFTLSHAMLTCSDLRDSL